jgi:serine/threonine protein kinase/dienelactone hydrolase
MIGQTISHYKILEKLGEGGMGVVYKARDTKLDRVVALKFLPSHFGANEVEKERFIHEAKAASALQHNNICTIHEIDETENGQMFICMDLYEGETLKKKIEKGPLSIQEAVNIAIQIAEGLSHAHRKDIVHRDIKPANIFITQDGIVKIVDFGLAKLRGLTKLTVAGTTLGTVAYMSPEQASGEEVDHRTDIWSFGIVLCEMLTGQLPFKGEYDQAMIYSILNHEPAEPMELNKEMPEALDHIILKALTKPMEQRYQSFQEVLGDLKPLQASYLQNKDGSSILGISIKTLRQPLILFPMLFIFILGIWAIFSFINRNQKIKWATLEAIPRINKLVDEAKYDEAFNMIRKAEKYVPENSILNLWSQISRPVTIHTNPQGASIYYKKYTANDDPWRFLGQTPVDSVRLPYGLKRFKIEKEGYETIVLAPNICIERDQILNIVPVKFPVFNLDLIGQLPENMVRVLPTNIATVHGGFFGTFICGEFLMDKYEVTNKEYKTFVDSGGYQKKAYWKYPFFKNNSELSWDEAMSRFTDRTGRQGPATWEVGDYPDGQDDLPVTGISWYEAAAFAEFKGKSLPTITHFSCAAGFESAPQIVQFSNFHGKDPAAVGSRKGMSPYGTYDMAGNVREWCWNQMIPDNERFILGGGWNDPDYDFGSEQCTQDPFDRSETNGFRCVKYSESDSSIVRLSEPVQFTYRNYSKEQPVSEFEFNMFLRMYAYSKTALNSRLESVYDHETDWVIEKVSFDAAYGNERVGAYLFLPKKGAPPFQTIVFVSGSHAIGGDPEAAMRNNHTGSFDFILKSGRAVLFPVYKGTFERSYRPANKIWNDAYLFRDFTIMFAKDLNRSIDYLETRTEINTDKLAYLGLSYGAWRAGIMLAVENRFKAAILNVGGLPTGPASLPEVDEFNFVPRIKIPVLMLNGKYDHWFPYETSQIPFYELLGTPDEHKKHYVYKTWHMVPRDQRIKETLAWLDKYLGPVM